MNQISEIMCFVCDKFFSFADIKNHMNKCKVNYETKNMVKLLVPEEYGLLFEAFKAGMMPDPEEIENFNRMIDEQSVKTGTAYATKEQIKEMNSDFLNTIKESKTPIQQNRQKGERPRLMVCPLCGREFGSMSLSIHMKKCRDRFILQQQDLPKNMRKDPDKLINSYNANNAKLKAEGTYSSDKMNNDAFEAYNENALVRCDNCGRTFLPDRLIVHQRSCLKNPKKK